MNYNSVNLKNNIAMASYFICPQIRGFQAFFRRKPNPKLTFITDIKQFRDSLTFLKMMSVTPAAFKRWNFPLRFLSVNCRRVVRMLWNDKWLRQLRKWEITEPHQTADGIPYFKSFLQDSALKRSNCLSFVLSLNGLCMRNNMSGDIDLCCWVFFFSFIQVFNQYSIFIRSFTIIAMQLYAWDINSGVFKWAL